MVNKEFKNWIVYCQDKSLTYYERDDALDLDLRKTDLDYF